MKFHHVGTTAAMAAVAGLAYGCSTSVTASTTIVPPANCSTNTALACQIGDGWTCAGGTNPVDDGESDLSCSVPQTDAVNPNEDDFCCIQWTSTSSTCTPDDQLTQACQYPALGYQCEAGDNPTSLDSSLNCSTPVTDPENSAEDDFCCE
ncbi:MAG TPA: hypothetical protein VEK07_08965 [Polyangiaceae bacterium]|nr:hypothetical protein [Polyangiaceae bacterium]